jgi:hypothetical protein
MRCYKNDLVIFKPVQSNIERCFSTRDGTQIIKNGTPQAIFWDDFSNEDLPASENIINLIANIKKLSPDELIIRDIIT